MKIIILSDANSIHTIRWVEAIKENNFTILLYSLFKPNEDTIEKYKKLGVIVESPDLRLKIKTLRKPNITKLKYITCIYSLKKIINNFKPDLIHAHYASSYGVLAFLSLFKPFFLSVWGSDIYDFPNKNFLNKWILKRVIKSADIICSTSKAMKKIIELDYERFDTNVIPFGINTSFFKPINKHPKIFTVGTIKSIESYNGIECLLNAAKIIVHDYSINKINFLIVGKGSLHKSMKQKTIELKLQNNVKFTGFISHENILKYHQQLSVFIAVSTRESFGVSVLEAASCGVPTITSNIGGLTEVNKHKQTGYIIKPDDSKELADAIVRLFKDDKLRSQLGENARERVCQLFEWNQNINQMMNLYLDYKS